MSPGERNSIRWTVLCWTISAPLALRLGPAAAFETWRQRRPSGPPAVDAAHLMTIADEILLIRIAGRLLFRTRCLKRTLVIWRLLRAYGHDPRAIIGFDREGRGLAGHAWLELESRRLADPVFSPPRIFVPFLSIGDTTVALTGDSTPAPTAEATTDSTPAAGALPVTGASSNAAHAPSGA